MYNLILYRYLLIEWGSYVDSSWVIQNLVDLTRTQKVNNPTMEIAIPFKELNHSEFQDISNKLSSK